MPISFSRSAASAVVSLASLAALPAPAFGQTTQASLEQRYQELASEERTRAGDPEYDYLLGMAAADSGHLGEALIAFQRVLAKQPNNAQARAEYARVFALAGDVDTAKREFDTVSADPTIPDPVRNRFGRLVRGFDSQIAGGGSSVTGFIDAEGGYDSNINTATNATSITLPVFAFLGPATLNGAARNMSDGFYQLQGGISGSTGLSRQTRAYISSLVNWRDNAGSRAFDQAAVTGTLGVVHSLHNGDAISLSGQVQKFWLGHAGYRTSYGAVAQYTKRLGSNRALAISGQYVGLSYDNNGIIDANRFGGAITLSGKNVYLGLGGGKEQTRQPATDHLSHLFLSAQAGTEYPLNNRMALLAGASVEHRKHDAPDPLFLAERKDTQIDGTLGLRYALGKGLSLRPRVTYTRNFSNIALNDYERVTASVAVRFEF